jgi:hypothetical protein
MATLISKPGITNASVLTIPTTWGGTWFRSFVNNQLTGADVRNAIAGAGITISGNLSTPYATISAGGSGNPTFTGDVTITPTNGVALTINQPTGASAGLYINAHDDQNVIYVNDIGPVVDGVTALIITNTGTNVGWFGSGSASFAGAGTTDIGINCVSGLLRFGVGTTGLTVAYINQNGEFLVQGASAALNANLYLCRFITPTTTAGQSYGLQVIAGTNTADETFTLVNVAETLNYMVVQGGGAVFLPAIGTTATTANMTLVAGTFANSVLKFTSSLRYKTNVNTIKSADIDAVLQMRPVTYTSLAPADDPTTVHLGFIAEEMALIDPRLVQYTPSQWQQVRNPIRGNIDTVPVPNAPMIPDSVQYSQLTALLVGAVQTLAQRCAALEAKTAAMIIPPVVQPALSLTGQYDLTGTNVVTTASAITTLPLPIVAAQPT